MRILTMLYNLYLRSGREQNTLQSFCSWDCWEGAMLKRVGCGGVAFSLAGRLALLIGGLGLSYVAIAQTSRAPTGNDDDRPWERLADGRVAIEIKGVKLAFNAELDRE